MRRFAFVTERPVAITMFMVAMAVFGFVSLSKLRVALLPEISYPTLTVRTTWPGSAPEDVEQRISEKVQEALSTLDDLVRSTSVSRAGVSDVVLDFDWGTPMTFAVQDVREKLDGVFLPDGAERPLILRYDPNLDPILRIGVRSPEGAAATTGEERDAELIRLRYVAENRMKRELEALEGVAAVQVHGGLIEEIKVRVDPYKLAAQGIDPAEIGARLAQENINASGGSLLEGSTEYLVRTLNEFVTVDDIADLPVARRGAATVRVRDVAEVERTYAKREVTSRIGGAESVELAVYREADANVVAVAQRVKDRAFGTPAQREKAAEVARSGAERFEDREGTDFLAHRLRKDVALTLLSDQSTFIRDAVRDVRDAALVGAVLSIGVMLLFLRRLVPTVIIALSIPISVVVTFAPMYMAGVTLNIMSLGGLALGIGMLVDNAIVVLESITRCRDEGDDPKQAARRGTAEVAGAVTASTLTTIAVFAPIVFVSGVAGQIFGDQALTVVTSLLVSLIVAVLFIPMLASRRFAAGEATPGEAPARPPRLAEGLSFGLSALVPSLLVLAGRVVLLVAGLVVRAAAALAAGLYLVLAKALGATVGAAFQAAYGAFERAYPAVLAPAVRRPLGVVLGAAAAFALAWTRVPHLGVELLPEVHQGEFTAFVKLGVGSPLEVTDDVLSKLDREVRALPGVASTALRAGVEQETLTREVEGSHTGRISVTLAADARDPAREAALEERVRALIASDPSVRSVEIERPTPFALEAPIAVEVRGYDLERIELVAREVERRLRALGTLSDVRTTLRPGHPEALVTFDRDKTLELGLDLAAVSGLVRDTVLGSVSTRFNEGDERIDVRVIADEALLASLQDVLDLPVNPSAPNPVPLRSVARVETVQGPAEIRRIRNTRAVVVSAQGAGLDLGGQVRRIEGALADLDVPDDVVVELGGQKQEMDEAQASMIFALLLAVFLVYVVMACQFESLLQPLVILLTVPLAGIGVIVALDLLDVPLSVVVFIGLIMLAGIVVNNAIVLVDRINQMRARGLALEDAVVEAGRARLRPILMTTATTVLGLLPMTGWLEGVPVVGALGSGEGAELRAPMAIAVITGLSASTVLTLVVIPTAYVLLAKAAAVLRRELADGVQLPPAGGRARARGFFEQAVHRPVALLVLFTTLIVIGAIAYRRIPVQLVPDGWTAPQLWLVIPNPGADAQENEEQVARVIEEQLRTLPGIESYESESSDDWVEMAIDFDGSMDMDLAKVEVRDRVERARPSLPDSVDQIFVWSEDGSSMPIAFFGILHPGDSAQTDFLMDKVVVPRLEAVSGVSKVDVWGVLQDSVRILLDEERVVAQNLDLGGLIGRLMRDNFAEPLGEVDDGGRKVLLRSDMRFRSLEEIEDYPLENGLRVRDLGEVARVKSVRNQLSRIDGSYSYFGVARKDSDSNVVETSRALRAALSELERDPRLAGEFAFIPFFLQGDMIESSLDQLKETAVWGGLLAVVVLFAFLRRVRLTLCVACSIPVSALLAIAWEYFSGGSFNLLTMCGVTLGIGMLVDNSVVVIENVARLRAEGESPKDAAAHGTREIALAVTLATLTTVVVFLPLIFMTGEPILRIIFGGIGIPLCLSLLFSLLVAVVFLPVIAARLLGERPAWARRAAQRSGRVTRLPVRVAAWAVGGARGAWHAALRAGAAAVGLAARVLAPARVPIALAAVALAAVAWRRGLPGEAAARSLAPYGVAPPSGSATALGLAALVAAALALVGLPRWRARPPLPPARPARLVPAGDSLLEMVIESNRRLVAWTVRRRLAAFGLATAAFLSILVPAGGIDFAAFGEDAHTDSVRFAVDFEAPFTLAEAEQELEVYERWLEERKDEIGFAHWSNRFDERGASLAFYFEERQDPDTIRALKRRETELPRIPAHRLRFYDDEEASERSRTVASFRIVGPDSGVLEPLSIEAQRILEGVPGLAGVKSSRAEGPEQVRVDVDRDVAHQLGVDTESLQQTISYVLHGFQLPRYQEGGRDVPLLIEYDQEKVSGLASLRDLGVWTGAGVVPLSSFASLSTAKGAHSIVRVDGRTSTTLLAEVEDPLELLAATERGYRALAQLELPRGYEIDLGDSARSRQEAEFQELLRALLLGVVLIFLLMGILFESMLLPLSVLFTIPFAILGSLWTLLLTGTPLDSMGWIGMIILCGVVVNNGIVLVDRIHRLYVGGMPRDLAVVTGSAQRVRPVLMTALTTVCGLVPMAIARPTGDGFDYRSLATIVAGGLVCSTFFTLWVVPLAYTVIQDLGAVVSRRARWWLRRPARALDPASGIGAG